MTVSLSSLQEIFQSALDEPVIITSKTSRDDLESWDSINHLNLIVELEDKLKISFTKNEIQNISSVQELLAILETK